MSDKKGTVPVFLIRGRVGSKAACLTVDTSPVKVIEAGRLPASARSIELEGGASESRFLHYPVVAGLSI